MLPHKAKAIKVGRYYRIINADGYPIADKNGNISVNRYALYEKLGCPDSVPCHWCQFVLPWKSTNPKPQKHIICANTIDFNPANGHPDNLVPSCFWCAINRPWAHKLEPFWTQCRKLVSDIPPHKRPHLESVVRRADLLNQWDHDTNNFIDGVNMNSFT